MPQVSRRFLDKKVEKKLSLLFPKCVSECRDIKIAGEFIDDLLTPTEKIMVAKRIAIALMILKKNPVSLIEETLKVSKATVYSVAGWLQYKGSSYRSLLEKIVKEDEAQKEEHEQINWELENTSPRGYHTNWKADRRSQWQKLDDTEVPF